MSPLLPGLDLFKMAPTTGDAESVTAADVRGSKVQPVDRSATAP
jgi:hypothetical protein